MTCSAGIGRGAGEEVGETGKGRATATTRSRRRRVAVGHVGIRRNRTMWWLGVAEQGVSVRATWSRLCATEDERCRSVGVREMARRGRRGRDTWSDGSRCWVTVLADQGPMA